METIEVLSCVDCKTFLTCRKMGELCQYFVNNFLTQKEFQELEAEMNEPSLEPLLDEVITESCPPITEMDEAGFEHEDKE